MTSQPVRAIVGARVSHVQGPEKTSHITQHETGGRYAAMHGWEVVGSFEDLDVSAIKTTPWERPDLRPWLTERAHEWDALIVAKTDRLFRSAKDCVDMAHWAEQNSKALVIVDDGLKLDFHTPERERDAFAAAMTKVFLILASVFAEIEGRRYVQRAEDRVKTLRSTDRWGWGVPTYGYVIVDHPSGKGKALAHDSEMSAVLHAVADLVIGGSSLTGVVSDLNEQGTLSPRDIRRVRRGQEPRGERWAVKQLRNILSSPATQGYKITDGRVALREDGSPITVGPPMFEPAVWDRLQRVLTERALTPNRRRHSSNPMLGVGLHKCGKTLSQRVTTRGGKTYRYYECGQRPRRCDGQSIQADHVDGLVEQEFLEQLGDELVQRRVFVPGEDSSYELDEVNDTIDGLRDDRAAGLYRSPEDKAKYQSQMAGLLARRDDLASRPVRAAGYDYVPTGTTYREAWSIAGPEDRRRLLVEAGVRVTVHGPRHVELFVPTDIRDRMRKRPLEGP